ncbi:hypothetical protein EVAR_3441_1 [Eumeta japonica]|uniref:Uncharacterized protein n=1 Tax=Eumeta variegata TaxID=151549 RepID=A0A4C1SUU5_EUMVA|nr:hypothetical protein EVAR_3441_1 [Eumeta japonica]
MSKPPDWSILAAFMANVMRHLAMGTCRTYRQNFRATKVLISPLLRHAPQSLSIRLLSFRPSHQPGAGQGTDAMTASAIDGLSAVRSTERMT